MHSKSPAPRRNRIRIERLMQLLEREVLLRPAKVVPRAFRGLWGGFCGTFCWIASGKLTISGTELLKVPTTYKAYIRPM
jgi:hypothetical protein